MNKPPIAIITGTTASGKSEIAFEFARARAPTIELINADSIQVYRGFDIGSAKPSLAEQKAVSHHLINCRDPDTPYTAGDFYAEVQTAIETIHSRGHRALIVGGTGFYLKTLLYGLWEVPKADPTIRAHLESLESSELISIIQRKDPQVLTKFDKNDRYRLIRAAEIIENFNCSPLELEAKRPRTPNAQYSLWVLDRDSTELHARIERRAQEMLNQGFVEETKKLLNQFPNAKALRSVGYRQVIAHLRGEKPESRPIRPGTFGLLDEICLATRQLVKKQRTWFNSEPTSRWIRLDEERKTLMEQLERLYD